MSNNNDLKTDPWNATYYVPPITKRDYFLSEMVYGYNEGLFFLSSYVVLDYALARLFYLFPIYACVLSMDVFNGCSIIQLKK